MKHEFPGPYGRHVFRIIVCACVLAGCMREKDRLDEEVRTLCAKDGGIKVFEKVLLPANRFDTYGEIRVPSRDLAKASDDFFYEWDMTYYRKGNPSMWRNHFRLVRRVDGKVLGEGITYSRVGGDFPGPWQDSSFGCPERADIKYVNLQVFSVETSGK